MNQFSAKYQYVKVKVFVQFSYTYHQFDSSKLILTKIKWAFTMISFIFQSVHNL